MRWLCAVERRVGSGLAPCPDDVPNLSDSERARWAGFGPARQTEFLAGRLLAKHVAARYLGQHDLPELTIDALGRSSLPQRPELFLSLSHSAGCVACVIADTPVGLDIENLVRARDVLALAQQVHSPTQQQVLQSLPEPARSIQFYRWWTLKEAWLKRQGLGLDLPKMQGLEFAASQTATTCLSLLLHGNAVHLALALNGPSFRPEQIQQGLQCEGFESQDLQALIALD